MKPIRILCPAAICIAGSLLAFPLSVVAAKAERVTSPLVLYTFQKPGGNVVKADPVGKTVDLTANGSPVVWKPGRITLDGSSRLRSIEPARIVNAAIQKSGAVTVEVWLRPADANQSGPARIVTLSRDPGVRNLTLGQEGHRFDVRLRTQSTNENGIPSLATPDQTVTSTLTHVVYTHDSNGQTSLYVNGKQLASRVLPGDLSGWSQDYHLILGNEATGDRPWQGDLHLVALFDRALSAAEVLQNFEAGVPDAATRLPPPAARRVDFVAEIQPILKAHCLECHAPGNEEGGLNLGIRRLALAGGKSGRAIVSGASDVSPLVHRVAGLDPETVMPPEGARLTAAEIGLIRAWIDQGAEWPSGADVLDPKLEAARTHWAFQPLIPVPIQQSGWAHSPLDQFVLQTLESHGLRPAPPAAAATLIRRMTFDLTGLPPTPGEIRAFVQEEAADPDQAVIRLADRLLASPHYGERWGRHWLDVARYADSDGQETDRDRPAAFQYRDYVIRALNADQPYDEFIRWQIAGDEFEPGNPQAVAATGFLAAGPFAGLREGLLEDERLRNRYNELDDIVGTLGTGVLGLTLGCVRCHDHKYDAIPARDYYGLLSAFQNGDRAEVEIAGRKIYAYRDFGREPRPAWLFRRGDYYDREIAQPLGFVSLMTRDRSAADYWAEARAAVPNPSSTLQRRAVASWITDLDQGAGALMARVLVNRVWQHHFGQPIVRTVGDFGARSEPPTHPELLEWLTADFVARGWSLKRLHRQLVTSATYRQSSQQADATAADPANRWLNRMRPLRLEAESLRDAMLSVSGQLNDVQLGPGFKPPISPEAIVARNTKDPYPQKVADSAEHFRRSIYMFHKRVVPYPLLQAFDKPDAQQSCSRRDTTTVAPQALALLNDPFARRVSLAFADRLQADSNDPAVWIREGYWLALGRPPRESELALSLSFLELQTRERSARGANDAQRSALADLCQAWFSLNEFLFVD